MSHATPRYHFLVIAAASPGAWFFLNEALQPGHSVTALCTFSVPCRCSCAVQALLDKATLTIGNIPSGDTPCVIQAFDRNILDPETFQMLLYQANFIDRVCFYIKASCLCQMLRRDIRLYSQIIQALITGMRDSR